MNLEITYHIVTDVSSIIKICPHNTQRIRRFCKQGIKTVSNLHGKEYNQFSLK